MTGTARLGRSAGAATRDLRRAWIAVALVPVGFVAATALGGWLVALLGYPPGDGATPLPQALLAGVPALVVLLAPGVAALLFGRRAVRGGRRGGLVPAWLGGAAAALLLLVNLAASTVGR
jgi:hypothetical protein